MRACLVEIVSLIGLPYWDAHWAQYLTKKDEF
jgi:hypothetical protein